MSNNFVFLSLVDVFDDKVFTQERADKWIDHILDSYECIFHEFEERLTSDSFVRFFLSKSLLDEVVVDAIIGMRKITDSVFNSVEDPNSFKIISYLTYWWLRHKPVSLHYPEDCSLNNIEIVRNTNESDQEHEYRRQTLIWKLKHINELVAVNMAVTYIFDLNQVLCDEEQCERIIKTDDGNFCFGSYDEMRDIILQKLTYYFSYRTISPKMIEHLFEAYTFHPAWRLTGPQWTSAKGEAIAP